jgi:hypothetical protein
MDESSTTTAKLDQARKISSPTRFQTRQLEAAAAGTCSLGTYSFGQAFYCP